MKETGRSKIEQNDGEAVSLLTHERGPLLSGRMSELITEETTKGWEEKHYSARESCDDI
jgi:hypothetical protein